MAKPIGLNIYIYNFGFLLLLILPANSMEEIEAQADSQLSTAGVNYWIEEKSVPWHQQETTHFKLKEPEVHSLEEEVTQAELDAVDEDISAVYIIRAILKRAEALKISKFEAMAQIPDGNEINEELNTKPKVPTELHAQQTLKKAKVRKTEEEKVREIYAALWKDSNLLDAEMGNLTSGLVGALKDLKLASGTAGKLEELEKVEYLKTVNEYITKFQKKMPESHKRDLLYYGLVSVRMPRTSDITDVVEMCKKLHQEYVDFLKQIRMEVELHYTFKSTDLQESGVITKILMKKWMHGGTKYKPLLDLNNEVRKMHIYLVPVLKSPSVNEQNLFKCLSEEAEQAKSDKDHEAERILTWGKNYLVSKIYNISDAVLDSTYRKLPELLWRKSIHDEIGGIEKATLERLFFMCDAMHSILLKLPDKWLEEKLIHGQIRDKLEMSIEWYSDMHTVAYPNIQGHYKLTKEMVHLRVELLLAKTLLVYERLDKFYKISSLYKMWKAKKMPEEMPYSLLKTYFDEFEQKKLAAFPNDHGKHA